MTMGLACGARPANTGGDDPDGAAATDKGVATGDAGTSALDAGTTTPDGGTATLDAGTVIVPGQVTVVTDRSAYATFETARVTVHNGTDQAIFLGGCSILTREHLEQNQWVDHGPDRICTWEGLARRVGPGESLGQDTTFELPGQWRVAVGYGTGCEPDKPLSGANCTGQDVARSLPVEVTTDRATCERVNDRYEQALESARACNPAINTPQCLELVYENLYCGCPTYVNNDRRLQSHQRRWEELGCGLIFPGCDVDCAVPSSGACVNGSCVDQWQ
jgi:hypothetical protein